MVIVPFYERLELRCAMPPPKISEGVTNWVTACMAVATHGNTKQAWHTVSVYQLLDCFSTFKPVTTTGPVV